MRGRVYGNGGVRFGRAATARIDLQTGDDMKRSVAILAALAMVGCNQGKQAESAPHGPSIAATASVQTVRQLAPSKPELDCATNDAHSDACKVYAEVQKTLSYLQGFAAVVILDRVGHKKNAKPVSAAQAEAEIGHLSRIDTAMAPIADEQVRQLFTQFRDAYLACEDRAYAAKPADRNDTDFGDVDDAVNESLDSCSYEVQRQADGIGHALNIRIPETQPDIFGMTWGMSMADVARVNPKSLVRDADSISYKTTVGGEDATALLSFVDNKLSRVLYILHAEHANTGPYPSDFDEIDSLLKDKYGNPDISGPEWTDDLYKNDRSQWGMAVATGRMQMRSEWQTQRTKITHLLTGDNYTVSHYIGYESREFKLAAKQAKEAEKKRQL